MAIPPFTLDDVLPPYAGSNPGGPASAMSPYQVTVREVVDWKGMLQVGQEHYPDEDVLLADLNRALIGGTP